MQDHVCCTAHEKQIILKAPDNEDTGIITSAAISVSITLFQSPLAPIVSIEPNLGRADIYIRISTYIIYTHV